MISSPSKFATMDSDKFVEEVGLAPEVMFLFAACMCERESGRESGNKKRRERQREREGGRERERG